ncbi:unnamed protein product [Arabis nemorensis]|uniref:Uncharacterized protein n=1 Tax=Arabis nemorensis TaxID=586526 RepID=A0A565CK15_9BRAS|nr:unnamed protein product [Arabis nemorensis]
MAEAEEGGHVITDPRFPSVSNWLFLRYMDMELGLSLCYERMDAFCQWWSIHLSQSREEEDDGSFSVLIMVMAIFCTEEPLLPDPSATLMQQKAITSEAKGRSRRRVEFIW